MILKKTVPQREKELQALLATPAGRDELYLLEARYWEAGGKLRPANASVITWILIYERELGLLQP